MQYYIGADMGTSAIKLLLVKENGAIIAQAACEYDYDVPHDDWREIEPSVWAAGMDSCMLQLKADVGKNIMKQVAAIGITGQMHTTCFLSADGRSIRPAIMWNDNRAVPLVEELKEKIKGTSVACIANIISSGSPAVNLSWLKRHEPENFQKLHKFLIGPDYLVHYLTGSFGTDYCEASTSSLFDLCNGAWSEEIRQLVGLSSEQYPEVRGSSVLAGAVRKELAEGWCLSDKVQVVAGTGDNAAAAVASGAASKGFAVMSLGTSGVLVFTRECLDTSLKGKNILLSSDGKHYKWLVQGVLQSCCRTLNWWIKKILQAEDFGAAFAHIDLQRALNSKLMFYPHIMGDKTIYGDTGLRGAFLGLSESHAREDLLLAILEGMAFATRELIEKMGVPMEQISPLRFTGGGARNKLWLQIMASVLNVPVRQMSGNSSAGYGAALLAMQETLSVSEEPGEVIYPAENLLACYQKKYNNYLRVHDALSRIYA